MAKEDLQKRDPWQPQSGPKGKAGKAEKKLTEALRKNLDDSIYEINDHPSDFRHLYENLVLSEKDSSEIYNPGEKAMATARKRGWGVTPDFSIKNKKTGKTLFGEIKRQDGWVEGKKSNAGRGNVHERMCKLFTPGLIKV